MHFWSQLEPWPWCSFYPSLILYPHLQCCLPCWSTFIAITSNSAVLWIPPHAPAQPSRACIQLVSWALGASKFVLMLRLNKGPARSPNRFSVGNWHIPYTIGIQSLSRRADYDLVQVRRTCSKFTSQWTPPLLHMFRQTWWRIREHKRGGDVKKFRSQPSFGHPPPLFYHASPQQHLMTPDDLQVLEIIGLDLITDLASVLQTCASYGM